MTNMETNLPYLERDKDRHGNPRIYVRRNGKRVRIREQEGTLGSPGHMRRRWKSCAENCLPRQPHP